MRLKNGYIPLWLEDFDKFFQHSPNEFSYFYFLLANAHYDDVPYYRWVKGKTKKGEKYVKEWKIQKGDIFISKKEIRDFWRFHFNSQKKILESLQTKGLIEILLEDPALIIRIPNREYFLHASKQDERPIFNREPSNSEQGVFNSEQGVFKNVPSEIKNDQVDDKIEHKVRSRIRKREEGEGTENAALCAAGILPPFLNSKEELGRLIPIRPREITKTLIPEDASPLSIRWYNRVKERAPNRGLGFLDITAQIEQLKNFEYSEEYLANILHTLETTSQKYALKFISPADAFEKPWGKDLIELANADFLSTEKGKEILKKKIEPSGKLSIRERIQAEQERILQEQIAKFKADSLIKEG